MSSGLANGFSGSVVYTGRVEKEFFSGSMI